jgi:hypothetical protein
MTQPPFREIRISREGEYRIQRTVCKKSTRVRLAIRRVYAHQRNRHELLMNRRLDPGKKSRLGKITLRYLQSSSPS